MISRRLWWHTRSGEAGCSWPRVSPPGRAARIVRLARHSCGRSSRGPETTCLQSLPFPVAPCPWTHQSRIAPDRPAASVRFAVRGLDSDRFLIEKLVAIGVPARRSVTARFEAVWPEDTQTGLYVVEHELLDGEGSVIQEVRRRLGALVAVVTRDTWDADLASWREPRQQFPYTRPRVSLVVPDGEEVTAGTMGIFRYRLVNGSYEEKKLRLYYAVGDGSPQLLRTLEMESREQIEGDLTLTPSRDEENVTLHLFEENCEKWDCDRPTPVPTEPWGYLQSANTNCRVVEPKPADTKE